MSVYYGFSTQHVENSKPPAVIPGVDGGAGTSANQIVKYGKKVRLTDSELVIRDLLNALNIPKGQKPGRPDYGTSLWSFIFEPNTIDTQMQLEEEIRRVAQEDPRIILNTVTTYNKEHGILIELELAIAPFNEAQSLAIFFDQNAKQAYGM